MTVYQIIEEAGPRATRTHGYFQNQTVATAVAEALGSEEGSNTFRVDEIPVDESADPQQFLLAQQRAAALAKLTDEERQVLGLV